LIRAAFQVPEGAGIPGLRAIERPDRHNWRTKTFEALQINSDQCLEAPIKKARQTPGLFVNMDLAQT